MDGQNIANTPGIFYAIAYLLSCSLMIVNGPMKRNRCQTVLIQALLGVLLTCIMVFSDGVVIFFIPFMLLYMGIIFSSIYINCSYDVKTAAYFAVRAFIIGEFAASFEWQIAYYLVHYLKVPKSRLTDIVILIVVYGIVFLALYQLEKKNREVNKKLTINGRELLSAAVIGLAIFSISNMSYITESFLFSSNFAKEIYIIRTLVDFGGVAILYAYHIQLGELNARLGMEKLQDMLNMQYNNYEMLEKSINAVNQKYHDLKYQIAVLKAGANVQDSISYLEQMEREIKVYEAQNKTGNKIIDTILTGKAIYCQSNWIELTCVADGTAVDFMNDMDISILFGNMLDNAIESVSKIDQKERRLIHLVVTRQKGFLRIKEENCCDNQITFEDGLPVTTKSDKRYHGFGLKSIQSTVKKYGGSVTINAENGWFELRILIPLPEQQRLSS